MCAVIVLITFSHNCLCFFLAFSDNDSESGSDVWNEWKEKEDDDDDDDLSFGLSDNKGGNLKREYDFINI